jgi:ubiquinone/menaquinone biosynthesis C-methylase UbiE
LRPWLALLALAACGDPEPSAEPSDPVQPGLAAPPLETPPSREGHRLPYTPDALALEEALLAHAEAPDPQRLTAIQAQAAAAVQADPDYSYLRLLWVHTLALGGQPPPPDALDPAERAWHQAWIAPRQHALAPLLMAHRVHACLLAEGREIPAFLLRSGEEREDEPIVCGGMHLDPAMTPDDYSIFERMTLRSRGRGRLQAWSPGEDPFGVTELMDLIGLRPGMRVADLGAGVGWLSMPFARAVGPQGTVFALEIDPHALELLRALANEPGLDALEPVASRVDDTTLAAGSVDLIFVCDTLKAIQREELEDPVTLRPLLISAARALTPEGRLVVVEKPDPQDIHRRVSMDQLIQTISAAGFRLVDRPEDLLPKRHVLVFEPVQGG